MRAWSVCLTILAVSTCALGAASTYWVEYDPGAGLFPEQAGWTRYTSGGGDVRYFEDGALVLDGQPGTHDAYAWYRPGELDPAPGEIFVAQWTLCVSQIDPPYPLDPSVVIYSDSQRGIAFDFGYDNVRVDPGETIPFEPGVFHEYEVRSATMLSFDVYIDGLLVYSAGSFPTVGDSLVGWGDMSRQAGSQSRWSTFSFGVIPEPCSAWPVLVVCLMRLRPRG